VPPENMERSERERIILFSEFSPSMPTSLLALLITLGSILRSLLLWIAWSHFDLATDNNALSTFIFLMLLYFAAFSVVSARERSWFSATMPSKTLLFALSADVLIGLAFQLA